MFGEVGLSMLSPNPAAVFAVCGQGTGIGGTTNSMRCWTAAPAGGMTIAGACDASKYQRDCSLQGRDEVGPRENVLNNGTAEPYVQGRARKRRGQAMGRFGLRACTHVTHGNL